MKAKDLFNGGKLNEGDFPPVGPGGPPGRGRMGLPGRGMRRGPEGMEDGPGMEGSPGAEQGQFSHKERDMLKDVMMLMLAGVMRSEMDTAIAMKIINGEPLDPGEMSHIVDETSNNVKNLPGSHGEIMQKLHQLSQG